MLDFGSDRPTHPCTKFSCSNPSMYQFFCSKPIQLPIQFRFIVKPIHVPKIQAQNPSMYRNFMIFLENGPPMCVHQSAFQNPSMYQNKLQPHRVYSITIPLKTNIHKGTHRKQTIFLIAEKSNSCFDQLF